MDAMDRKPDRTVIYPPGRNAWDELRLAPDFPNPDSLSLLMHCSWDSGGPFQCLLKYGGGLYNFVLEFDGNSDNEINRGLQRIHQGLSQRDYNMMDEGVTDCLGIVLSFLKANHEGDLRTKMLKKDEEDVKVLIKSSNGSLTANHHNAELHYQFDDHCGGPVENPFSHLRVFAGSEVERLEEEETRKVRIDGKVYFLKKAFQTDSESFVREFSILGKMPYHPNVIYLCGVTRAGEGKIDGLVTPFIHGSILREINSATKKQKVKWKKQISDAVHFLHRLDIVWGDAAVQNVMIEHESDRAVLIDFGGGISKGWVDDDLYETRKGDLQALGRLHAYIDNLEEKL